MERSAPLSQGVASSTAVRLSAYRAEFKLPAGQTDAAQTPFPVALSRTAALVEFAEDPIIGLTLDGVITDWNPAAERLYGYSAEEALGASIAMLVPPERRGRSGSLLATVRAGEAVRQVDTQRMAKDGRRIDVSISMAPIRDAAGVIVGAAAFTRDISMRIEAEERLRRSEAQLAEAQALAGLGSWEWNVVSDELSWSPELYRIFGLDPDRSPATSTGFFDAIHPADRQRVEAAVHETVDPRRAARATSAGRCGPMGTSA